jgi:uncharacterized protein (DUF2235 family)
MAKNLIVCCDGTWNTPEQREGGLPCPTNVVKLHNLSVEDESQRRYYHPGVGTNGGVFDKALGGGVGVGISQNIKSAYEWLCRNYATGIASSFSALVVGRSRRVVWEGLLPLWPA